MYRRITAAAAAALACILASAGLAAGPASAAVTQHSPIPRDQATHLRARFICGGRSQPRAARAASATLRWSVTETAGDRAVRIAWFTWHHGWKLQGHATVKADSTAVVTTGTASQLKVRYGDHYGTRATAYARAQCSTGETHP